MVLRRFYVTENVNGTERWIILPYHLINCVYSPGPQIQGESRAQDDCTLKIPCPLARPMLTASLHARVHSLRASQPSRPSIRCIYVYRSGYKVAAPSLRLCFAGSSDYRALKNCPAARSCSQQIDRLTFVI